MSSPTQLAFANQHSLYYSAIRRQEAIDTSPNRTLGFRGIHIPQNIRFAEALEPQQKAQWSVYCSVQ
jgi:hypothetical protein